MLDNDRLPRSFFARSTLTVARELLGARLVRDANGERVAGLIVETEAYRGEEDQGCHARAGLTARTRVMYGSPGHAYVYFTYGMHWLFNCVTERAGFPAAVLVRALIPTEGLHLIAQRREGQPRPRWTDGPAKLCQALSIDGSHHGIDLCDPKSDLFLEKGLPIPDSNVTNTPRVGLNNVPEPWKSIQWRFVGRLNDVL
ncbi:MAG: DNA-3-methyladenine glycosylase [Anaerolineales bacterium]|jgi:DNA-3-methyladenine glycosylase